MKDTITSATSPSVPVSTSAVVLSSVFCCYYRVYLINLYFVKFYFLIVSAVMKGCDELMCLVVCSFDLFESCVKYFVTVALCVCVCC